MSTTTDIKAAGEQAINETIHAPLIYQKIPEAIAKIGAIGKNKKNSQQGFMFRGIDDVYNSVNPILAECGLFLTSEVIDQSREERETKSGGRLVYTILTMRYTVWATDGSHVTTVTVGEGMDSGDKGTNKAMSIAYKYALFQLLCIPTEEAVDPDLESHPDVLPRGKQAAAPRQTAPAPAPAAPAAPAAVTTAEKIPTPAAPAEDPAEKAAFVKSEVARINNLLGDPGGFQKFRTALIERGELTSKASIAMTMAELRSMFGQIESEARRLNMVKTDATATGDAA